MIRRLRIALATMLAIAAVQTPSAAAPPVVRGVTEPLLRGLDSADFVHGAALVRFAPSASRAQRVNAIRRAGARLERSLELPNWVLVRVRGDLAGALARLRRASAIDHAEPHLRLRVQTQPNDPCNTLQKRVGVCPSTAWHLFATSAFSAWDRFPGRFFSPSQPKSWLPGRVKVAVIDAAVPRDNVDFKNRHSSDDMAFGGQLDVAGMQGFRHGVPFYEGPAAYHGAYVAGLVGATPDNSYASAGIGYAADLLPLPAVDGRDGRADSTAVGAAILYAHERGSRVINLSLGLTQPSSYVYDAIQTVVHAASPALVVAAAGNNTGDQPFYPAWFDNVMAVGGTDQNDRRAPCANFGPKTSVAAPARQVQSLTIGSQPQMVAPDCGTSAAAPQVSGLAAMLFAQEPQRTPQSVRAIIEQSADDLGPPGWDPEFGWGRINADRALAYGAGDAFASNVTATPVRASGGTSTIRARVYSSSTIQAAEVFVDRVPSGAGDSGFAMHPVDGAFDEPWEDVTIAYSMSGMPQGAHRVLVRARDATGRWGAVSSGVAFVDANAPSLSQPVAPDAIRPLDETVVISFDVADDWSQTISYEVEAWLAGRVSVWRSSPLAGPAGNRVVEWTPEPTAPPGSYTIRVTARDEAGNQAVASTSMLLV